MLPVLTTIQFFGAQVPIYGYGAMMALGLFVGGGCLLLSARRAGLDAELALAVLGVAVFVGYLFAHGLFLLVAALEGQRVLPLVGRGGLVFYGGAVGGVLGAAFAARACRLPVLSLLDAAAAPLALGHAIGRLGCLLGGCCFGRPFSGPWAVAYAHPLSPHPDGVLRHPVQAYEALLLVLLAALLLFVPIERERAGRRFATYVAAYAALRVLLEALRADDVRGLFFDSMVSTSQLLSAVLFAIATTWLFRLRQRRCTPRACVSRAVS